MSDAVTVRLSYSLPMGATMTFTYDELRAEGIHLEDWQRLAGHVMALAKKRIKDREFDPTRDWDEYDHADLEIHDMSVEGDDVDWDDLTDEEKSRVPEEERP